MSSPGWDRFAAMVLKSWGPTGFAAAIDQIIARCREKNIASEPEIREAFYANRIIHAMMRWPEQRIAELRGERNQNRPQYTRGGY